MARTIIAATAVFATAMLGGVLHAAISTDPTINVSADQPMMIHEAGVARFVTTDTGMARFITTDTPRSPLVRGMQKLGLAQPDNKTIAITAEMGGKIQELGMATVSTGNDGDRTLTIRTPSEWVFKLEDQ